MTYMKKLMLPLGAIGLVLIGLSAPKEAHAVVAALVQVTNTAANPAITQDIGQQAAQMVTLYCIGNSPGGSCGLVPSSGLNSNPAPYSVPPNQTLVLTSADLTAEGGAAGAALCPTLSSVDLATNNGVTPLTFWLLAPNTGTANFVYPTGITVAPSSTVSINANGSACQSFAFLHGYLTTD
jgi:hypothetical protein